MSAFTTTTKTINLVAVLDTRTTKLLQDNSGAAEALCPRRHARISASVWVPSHDAGAVDIIDVATNSVVQSVEVDHQPALGDLLARTVKLAYVANHESNVLSVLDTESQTVLTTIPVGD